MKVSVSKSKNQTIYYLSKSVWVDGKSTTKTIEKIGSEDELLKVCGELTPLEWAKQYAAKRSAEEKASKKTLCLSITFPTDETIQNAIPASLIRLITTFLEGKPNNSPKYKAGILSFNSKVP